MSPGGESLGWSSSQVVAELLYFFQLEFGFQNTSVIPSCVTISVASSVSDPVTSSLSLSLWLLFCLPFGPLCVQLEVGIRSSEPVFHPSPGAWLLCQGGNLLAREVLGHVFKGWPWARGPWKGGVPE